MGKGEVMSKFLVEINLDGYESEGEHHKACLEFIHEQLNFSGSCVTVSEPMYDQLLADARELQKALAHYSNEEDNETYLDVFDCIKKPSESTTEFDEVKFGQVARLALKKFTEKYGTAE